MNRFLMASLVAVLLFLSFSSAWAQAPQFGQKPAPLNKAAIDAKAIEINGAFVQCWKNWTAIKFLLGWSAESGVTVDPKTVAVEVAQYGQRAVDSCEFMAREMRNTAQYYQDHGSEDEQAWPIPGVH